MSRLFWKIFFSFWLVMLLIVATNIGVTWVQAALFEEGEHNEHVAEMANKALEIYKTEGEQDYRHWRKKLYRQAELRVLLLDDHYQEVTGVPVPRHVMALLDGRFSEFNERFQERKFGKRLQRPMSWQVTDPNGKRFTFVILNPRELGDYLFAKTTLIWRILISALVVTIIALLLSLYLVKPIRQLQTASRKLADGDLSARVPAKLNRRKDELGELSQDFDAMAEKIEALMIGQQNMLRDVSHELRTPLTRLRIALELARKRSGESSELDRMELEAERINELIDEILQLVRLNATEYELKTESLALPDVLTQLVDEANILEPRVTLNCPSAIHLHADKRLVVRAINNVIQNALKYSSGAVEVCAKAHSVKGESKGNVEVIIRDHGPGVEEAQLADLFKPFYRTDDARSRTTGGYGLGLAIAAQAAKAHNGSITAKNHPEGGLAVTFVFKQRDTHV